MNPKAIACVTLAALTCLAGGGSPARAIPWPQGNDAQQLQCANNLREMGLALQIWATDHGNAFPPDVLSMSSNALASPRSLICPADAAHQPAKDWVSFTTKSVSYECLLPLRNHEDLQQVVFRCPIHGTVALLDGKVEQRAVSGTVAALAATNSSRPLPAGVAPDAASAGADREVEALQRDLQDKDPRVRRAAVEKLARRLGEGGQVLLTPRKELIDQYEATQKACAGLLARGLKDEDEQVRVWAASALSMCGPYAKEALPQLVEVLQGTDLNLKVLAVRTLGNLGTNAMAAVPVLERLLHSSTDQARLAVAQALWKITGQPGPLLPALIQGLELKGTNYADAWSSVFAAATLGEMGPEAKAAVPALQRLLQAADLKSRVAAAAALARISPDTEGLAEALGAGLRDVAGPSSTMAQRALREWGTGGIPVLMKVSDDPSPIARRLALETLGSIGEPAGAAVPVLAVKLRDPDLSTRRAAADALGRMGAASKPAVPALRAALQDTSGTVRAAAAVALIRVDAPALGAIPTLVAAISREPGEETAYITACVAAREISPAAVPAVLELMTAAPGAGASSWDREKTYRMRRGAIDLLGRMGPNAKSAVPALRRLMVQEGNESWRREIAEALQQIEVPTQRK